MSDGYVVLNKTARSVWSGGAVGCALAPCAVGTMRSVGWCIWTIKLNICRRAGAARGARARLSTEHTLKV